MTPTSNQQDPTLAAEAEFCPTLIFFFKDKRLVSLVPWRH